MNRRQYLAGACGTCCSLASVAGCVQTPEDPDSHSPLRDEATTVRRTDASGAWPQVAHDERNTSHAPEASGPRGEVSVAWRSLGDRPVYRPVVDDDLYLTESWTGGAALSLDASDGSERWTNRSFPPMRWAPALYDDPSSRSSSLLVVTRTSENVVRLHALDAATGEEQWSRAEGVTASSSSHPATGPTVADDRVYLGSNTGVLVLDAATGRVVWEAKLAEHVVETDDGPTWRTDWATPAVTDERVFTFDLNESYRATREVYAVDRETGDRDWTATLDLADGWYLTGHVVAGADRVFVSALDPHASVLGAEDDEWSGTQRLYALDAASGDVEWRWELQDSKLLGPPAYAAGTLFVGTWNPDADTGAVHAIDASDRSESWTYSTDAGGIGTPAVASSSVYVSQGEELAAVAIEDGSLEWRLPFDDYVSDPVVAHDAVYALTGGGRDEENHVVAVRSR